MNSPHSHTELVFRDILATMLNKMPRHDWDTMIQFAPMFHVDLEDEAIFAIHLNERIMFAAKALKKDGKHWTNNFEDLARLVASKIPELSAKRSNSAKQKPLSQPSAW